MTKENESGEKKPEKKGIHHHITKKVPIPVYIVGIAVILLLVFTVLKFPYQAKESYVEIEEVKTEKLVDDLERPVNVRVCDQVPSDYKIDYNNFVRIEKLGTNEFCEARLMVWNNEPSEGDWTIDFTFNVNGQDYEPVRLTKEIAGNAKDEFVFNHEECVATDKRTGSYKVIDSPTTEECKFITQYEKKTEIVVEKREVPKERIVTKYESLVQKFLGTNNVEKV